MIAFLNIRRSMKKNKCALSQKLKYVIFILLRLCSFILLISKGREMKEKAIEKKIGSLSNGKVSEPAEERLGFLFEFNSLFC